MAILLFASLPTALANAVCARWSLFLQLSSSYILAMSKKTHYQPPQHLGFLQDEWCNINAEDYLKTHCKHFQHISHNSSLTVLFGNNPVPSSRYSTWCTDSQTNRLAHKTAGWQNYQEKQ